MKKVCFLLLLFLFIFILELTIGASNYPLSQLLQGVWMMDSPAGLILWEFRIPRTLYAICLGVGLSLCGLALQGMFRNPLADPFTLGISGGAAFGAAAATLFGLETGGVTISIAAFLGALLSCLIVYLLASRSLFSKTALILGGVMIGYFFQSGLMLTISLISSDRAHGVIVWLMGDLASAPKTLLLPTITLTAIGSLALYRFASGLNVLSMGEEKAAALGENVQRMRRNIFVWSSVITGFCVAAVGIIGFVGLMIPHMVRRMVGPDYKTLFPLCALTGSIFVMACDLFSRTLFSPIEIPLGVITGVIGSLTFLWIFIMKREPMG
ncbi:MAG: FecCD family ABC transporter permease [bacterium]